MEETLKIPEEQIKNSLGCGEKFAMNTSNGFICGIANAWGQERLCPKCKVRLRAKWDEEDKNSKINQKEVL